MRVIRLWTYSQAGKALPYIRSITTSLRQHWLDARNRKSILDRLDKRSGPLNREALLARAEAESAHSRAEEEFSQALQELMNMDVFLLDPVQGVALIPFNKENNLAWFVFDLFDNDLKTWRFHEDTLETRRPISEALTDPLANPSEPRA
ncbi:MAG: DUF2203 family protein [Gemmataceae bacterium]